MEGRAEGNTATHRRDHEAQRQQRHAQVEQDDVVARRVELHGPGLAHRVQVFAHFFLKGRKKDVIFILKAIME